jgi:hypothetical protein
MPIALHSLAPQRNPAFVRKARETIDFYERELAHFRCRRLEMLTRAADREPHSAWSPPFIKTAG